MKDVSLLTSNGVNVEKSLELFGDMETYNDTLHDFLNEVEGKLAKIKTYKETADMANYAILVHSLKSDSKYFGFEKLAELAYNHEMESKANNMYYVTDHFDELMTEANRIVALVKQYMGITSGASTATTVKPLVIKDKTILVVDDSNVVRNFVYKIFSNEYDVLIANDGKEALDIIRANVDDKIVGMLLDLNMPNVDGFQVLDYFKQANLFSRIPVAIITGEGTQNNIQRAYQYPIVDMLQKPFNEVNVKNIVDKLIMVRNMNNH
ncbi:MAG: response regulator [Tenericutes bacterium]|nr:response regulator [Mycoplasmatota bacterium]